jgi:hypothetical protein
MLLKFGKDRGALRCPYCRDPIYPAPSVIRCLKCRTIHHEKCWEDRGSCSIYGCKGTPQLELSDLFYIELFQKRRKKLRNSKIAAVVTAVVVAFILFYALKPVLPAEGRLIFSFTVIIFLIIFIVLAGYAQYLCPACGRQPRMIPKVLTWRKVSYWTEVPWKVEGSNKLLLNPNECPQCKVRLRSA